MGLARRPTWYGDEMIVTEVSLVRILGDMLASCLGRSRFAFTVFSDGKVVGVLQVGQCVTVEDAVV
jgi:hypothetical protein